MTPRSLSDVQQSVSTFEYDDELLVVIDFGTVSEEHLDAELLGDTLIVTYETPNNSGQNIELSLPDEFNSPEVTINNGIITVKQPLSETDVDTESE